MRNYFVMHTCGENVCRAGTTPSAVLTRPTSVCYYTLQSQSKQNKFYLSLIIFIKIPAFEIIDFILKQLLEGATIDLSVRLAYAKIKIMICQKTVENCQKTVDHA